MIKQKLLTVNHFNSQSRSQVLPHSPLVSSQSLNLPQTQFDYYHQFSAHETPTHIHTHHLVSIALEKVKTERNLDGVLQTEQQFFGSIGIFPANVEHWSAWKTTANFASIAIQPNFFANAAYEIANQNCVELIPTFAHQLDRFISGIALAIKHELETNSDGCQLCLESLFNELAVYLLQNYTAKKPQIEEYSGGLSPRKLQTAIDYIQANLDTKIGLDDFAQIINISPYYFCRLFKQSTGITPYQYLIRCRVERAKILLSQGKSSIADVALAVGFSNQSQLTKHFKRLVGVTPKKFSGRSQ